MAKIKFEFPSLELTKEFLASFVPYPEGQLKSLAVPKNAKTFLIETGLPIHSQYHFWAGLSFTFYEKLKTINFCSCGKDNFLVIGELCYGSKTDSLLAININRGGVYSLHKYQHTMPYTQFFNSGIKEFVQCLGWWQVFSPIVWQYEEQLESQHISRFDYEDVLYAPMKEKIAQVDPKAIKKPRKNQMSWWPDVCSCDPGA